MHNLLVYMRVVDCVNARGHPNIRATHRTTLEFTKDEHLSRRGDCIVAVAADKGAADLSEEFRKLAKKDGTKISIIIEVGPLRAEIHGYGSSRLSFTHPTDMVIRKSQYTCGRTIAIMADTAAADLPREMVKLLQDGGRKVRITLVAER